MGKYPEDSIKKFYRQFKRFPEFYELEKVRFLISHTHVKAIPRPRFINKPIKLIIMSATIISFITVLFFWNFQNRYQATESAVNNRAVTNLSQENLSGNDQAKTSNETLKQDPLTTKNTSIFNLRMDNVLSEINISPESSSTLCELKTVDSTYLIENLKVFLTDLEMSKIGFTINDSCLCYYGNLKGLIDFTGNCPDDHHLKIIQNYFDQKELPFYAAFFSNGNFESTQKGFLQSRDTLVPIVFKYNRLNNTTSDQELIFWFIPHPDLFDSLPERYHEWKLRYQYLREYKIKYPYSSVIRYPAPKLDGINLITMNRSELENIGFNFYDDSIVSPALIDGNHISYIRYYNSLQVYDTTIYKSDGSSFSIRSDGKGLTRYIYTDKHAKKKSSIKINFTTNIIGELDYITSLSEDIGNLNTLIPIILKKELFPVLMSDIVYWLTPNEELFKRLPPLIAQQIKDEYLNIESSEIREKFNTNCTYFEVCKSTWQLQDLKIYPNPASSHITIDFTLEEEIMGSVSLVNSAGVQIKQLIPKITFNQGYNSHSVNVEGLTPGLYIISLVSEKGFITQRLIISK